MHFHSRKTVNFATLPSSWSPQNQNIKLDRSSAIMQASPGYPRPAQRRSPGTDSGPPPSSLPMPGGDGMATGSTASGPRSSSGSGRSQASRAPSQPDKQLSQIEKSVTHLLVATKQLLEMLTQWSRKTASEGEVSDIYVRLGYEFNLACRAFGAIGVDTSDLGPVPDLLRSILEDTLSQDASPQSLDRFLPRIRDIIINLLHGLKKKQAKLRSRQTRDGKTVQGRHPSSGSTGATETGLTQMLDETPATGSQSSPKRPPGRRYGSNTSVGDDQAPANPPMSPQGGSFSEREASKREAQRAINASGSSSSLSSATMQNIPVLTPYGENNQSSPPRTTSPPNQPTPSQYPRPPPTPKTNDALGALQRSGDLERRASRRFSAYQIQKHLGASPNGVPVIPPSQNSPIPNRGGDVRESMNAVRLRGSYQQHNRQRSNNRIDPSPSRSVHAPQSIAEENNEINGRSQIEKSSFDHSDNESPIAKTPADKLRQSDEPEGRDMPVVGALPGLPPIENSGSLSESFKSDVGKQALASEATLVPQHQEENNQTSAELSTPPQSQQFTPEQSPPPGKELTLFLQYKSKIKKYVLPEGYADLTIGRLQLAFIEKFAWNTHSNGADLPEIYVQDPVSGVRHELEDLNDVKDRSVLVLNVEALDEVKKHLDEGLGGIRRMIEGVRTVVNDQEAAIQRVSDRQLEAAKDMALLAAAPSKSASAASLPSKAARPLASGSAASSSDQLFELQNLRRDLAVLRQTYSNFTSDITTSMNTIRTKAGSVKTAAVEVSVPSYEGDAGRARVKSGRDELSDESERLVARVDDLQDLIEDLRKDVVTRGVRPLPRQLESVGKDISNVTKEVKKMQEFLKKEKPIWTKIWEAELQRVCEERDQLTMQEDLACDLEDDLEKAAQTFALVEQAMKQQNQNAQQPGVGGVRNASRNIVVEPMLDPIKAKDGVLGEVRALQPNHENRLEAIERAEKTRQKELETRRIGAFQKELGNFVEEGKLKKSGGVEEAERLRKTKDERNRRDAWEHQQARAAEMERLEQEAEEAEAAELAAAAAAAAGSDEDTPADDPNGLNGSPAPENEEKPQEESPQTPGM
ncbi:Bud site selection protein 6 [Arachnomyces sp. PD_36]|nr:Bud site selection protein 6 [Arachnomyces sp. PD_36]